MSDRPKTPRQKKTTIAPRWRPYSESDDRSSLLAPYPPIPMEFELPEWLIGGD
jgi:hypothetical protein